MSSLFLGWTSCCRRAPLWTTITAGLLDLTTRSMISGWMTLSEEVSIFSTCKLMFTYMYEYAAHKTSHAIIKKWITPWIAVFPCKYVLIVLHYSIYDCFFTISYTKFYNVFASKWTWGKFFNISYELYEMLFGFSSKLCGWCEAKFLHISEGTNFTSLLRCEICFS
jgi:hypothetical protein